MKDEDLLKILKQRYNYSLKRNKKAEEYFNAHTVEECERYKELFDNLTKELSIAKIYIEILLKRKITKDEVLNGFKL